MNAELKKYKARIFGDIYSIVSDENEEIVAQVVIKVDSLMKEIASKNSIALDAKRIAVLAALQVTSEMLVMQQVLQQEQIHSEKIMMLLYKEENSL